MAIVLAAAGAVAGQQRAFADADRPFRASYSGTFHVAFGAGTAGSDRLNFSGVGLATHQGVSTIVGRSDMVATSNPSCTSIENDSVTLTAANGDAIFIVNTGLDCLDTSGGSPVLHGSGHTEIVGGTGRFAQAHGSGSWSVTAPIRELQATFANGTFVLSFDATLSE
jgi:hypothetical protein